MKKQKMITIFIMLFVIIAILFVGGKNVYAKYILSDKISIHISTAPAPTTVNITVAKNSDGTATITANAKDNGSGAKEYKFYINNQLKSTVDATTLPNPLKSTYKFTYLSSFNNSFDCKVVIADKYNTINTSNTVTIVDYNIRTANDLKEFSTQTNKGNTYKGVTIQQATDINLNGSASNPWTPAGNFAGTYDGQGHMIRGLYINESANDKAFMTRNSGTIKNLAIAGSVSGNFNVRWVSCTKYWYNFWLLFICNYKGQRWTCWWN